MRDSDDCEFAFCATSPIVREVNRTSRLKVVKRYNRSGMLAEISSLTTEHLRLMRDDIAKIDVKLIALDKKMDDGFAEMKKRLSRVEQSMVGLKHDEA